jgi:hypothetical protein
VLPPPPLQLHAYEHVLTGLVNRHLPAVARVLHAAGIHPTMYAAQWLLTAFSYAFPFRIGERSGWVLDGHDSLLPCVLDGVARCHRPAPAS